MAMLPAAIPLAVEALAGGAAVAAPAVAAAAAPAVASTVAPALAATGLRGLIAGMPSWAKWAGATAGAGALFGLVGEVQNRAVHGTIEDQMRESIEIQRKLEMEDMQRQGINPATMGMSGIDDPELAGLLRRPSRSMTSLLMDEDFTEQLADVAKSFKKAERARSPRSSELDGIIAGNEAALAQIQSERILSPMELIQMIESMNG
jgi:hypothetical protein